VFQNERRQTHAGNSVDSQPIFNFFLLVRFSSKFAAESLLEVPPHPICVAAPRCETLMSENVSRKLMQQLTMNYEVQ